MPRSIPQKTEPVNADSFPDIVASVVGIMIIMVVLVGIRVKNAPVEVAIPTATDTELDQLLAKEHSLRADVSRISGEIHGLKRQAVIRGAERDLLATTVSVAEHDITERRKRLDDAKQADFDLARNLAESKSQLARLANARRQAETVEGAPIVVESYPTPISRVVDGPEAHIRIAGGRVMFVPLQKFLDALRARLRQQAYKLTDREELSDMIGPIDDFRLRYTIARYDVMPDGQGGRGGSYARVEEWTLIPTNVDLGEPVRLALMEGSEFLQTLSRILPGRTTITIWVYPDSFDAFRQIRKELYRLGYSIATRPLPPGVPIGGSPDGSKSAAQ